MIRERKRQRSIRCEGHIACSMVGAWDEAIIERAEIYDSHPDIDAAWNRITHRLGASPPDSGNIERNRRQFRCLVVRLIDGCELSIVASEFHVAEKVPCPRCGQDWLRRVRLPALDRSATWCPECDATWLDDQPATMESFEDLATLLATHGVKYGTGCIEETGHVTRPSKR